MEGDISPHPGGRVAPDQPLSHHYSVKAARPQTHHVVDAPLLLQEQLVLTVVIVQALQTRVAQTTQ